MSLSQLRCRARNLIIRRRLLAGPGLDASPTRHPLRPHWCETSRMAVNKERNDPRLGMIAMPTRRRERGASFEPCAGHLAPCLIVFDAECLLQLCLAVVHPMCQLRQNEIWHDGDVFGDQPQAGLGQYQPAGNDQTPTPRGAPIVYQPSVNGLTLPARANANSVTLVNAQLTPPYQPRRSSIGTGSYQQSRCSHARCVYGTRHRYSKTHDWWKMPQVVLQCATCLTESAACCMYGVRFTYGEARLQQRCNRETNHHYVHAHCVNSGLGHDNELHPKLQPPANGTPSPGQRQIQKCFPMRRTRIKPQQLRHLMMSETCLGVKRLSAWMKRSWNSSGSNTSRGTASKTHVAPTWVCFAASSTCHSSGHHSQRLHLIGVRVSLESAGAQQLAPSGTTCSERPRKQLSTLSGCATEALLG